LGPPRRRRQRLIRSAGVSPAVDADRDRRDSPEGQPGEKPGPTPEEQRDALIKVLEEIASRCPLHLPARDAPDRPLYDICAYAAYVLQGVRKV
jgi:hypothetical protein